MWSIAEPAQTAVIPTCNYFAICVLSHAVEMQFLLLLFDFSWIVSCILGDAFALFEVSHFVFGSTRN